MKASILSYYAGADQAPSKALPAEFVDGIQMLESILEMPVWLLVQDDEQIILPKLYDAYFDQRDALPEGQPVAVLLHSLGGDPEAAYRLASLIRKRCGEFVVLVPKCAKSAATLFALGASRIILGRHSELGPLDMQVRNEKSGKWGSALNYVQALDRLGDDAERIMYGVADILIESGLTQSVAVPFAINFATALVRPLVDNIDAEKYTEMSRTQKVGEEYAVRLLSPKYNEDEAKKIAEILVSQYPGHGFVIDTEEANSIGLGVENPTDEIAAANKKIIPYLDGRVNALGQLEAIEE